MMTLMKKKKSEMEKEMEKKTELQVDLQLEKFYKKFEEIDVCFVEAKTFAKKGQLKTATLRQAEGWLALRELQSHYNLADLDKKAAGNVEAKIVAAEANFHHLSSAAAKLSSDILKTVKDKDSNKSWSYRELPRLHEIFTMTDEVFYHHESSATEQYQQPKSMKTNEVRS